MDIKFVVLNINTLPKSTTTVMYFQNNYNCVVLTGRMFILHLVTTLMFALHLTGYTHYTRFHDFKSIHL